MINGSFTIFDFETTGLNPEEDRVIEMAAIHVCKGQVISEFSTLVNNGPISDKITEITGITNEELENGMNETAAFKFLSYMIGSNVIVAHNAAFDMGFLYYGLLRIGKTFANSFIDTLTISRERHYYPHKLIDMCERYDINLDGAHRALNDVYGCWELLKKLHAEEPIDDYVNKLGYFSKYGPPNWYPIYAELFPTENKYEQRSV